MATAMAFISSILGREQVREREREGGMEKERRREEEKESRGAKVNLHAYGSLPASQMKEHFEPLPEGEEERRCQACLMLAVCTWQAAPLPSMPCVGSLPSA